MPLTKTIQLAPLLLCLLTGLQCCTAAARDSLRVYIAPTVGHTDAAKETGSSACPTSYHSGPAEPCFTMEDIWGDQNGTQRGSWLPQSGSTIIFLSGRHVVNFSTLIVFRDIDNITLTSENAAVNLSAGNASAIDGTQAAEIFCAQPTGFVFLNISRLTISNIVFTRCGRDSVDTDIILEAFSSFVNSFFLFGSHERMSLFFAIVTDLTVSGVTVQNGTGYGILAVNVFGSSVIKDSTFMFNNFYTYSSAACNGTFITSKSYFVCAGGNVVMFYVDPLECIEEENPPVFSFNITSTTIAYGVQLTPYAIGAGLVVAMSQTAYGVHIYVDNVRSLNNSARIGANMAFVLYKDVDNSSVSITNSFVSYSNPLFHPSVLTILSGTQFIGGGLLFVDGRSYPTNFIPSCKPKSRHTYAKRLTITSTEFVGNNAILGGAMNLEFSQVDQDVGIVSEIIVENCSFRNNIGSPGSAVYVYQLQSIHDTLLAHFIFKNCTFFNNTYPLTEIPNSIQQFELDLLNTVKLVSVQQASFIDCIFQHNIGSGIYAYASLLRFNGNVEFVRNYGVNGGGMSLHGSSFMLLTPNTTISFLNNSAQFRGGGLFISSGNYRTSLICFWQLETTDFHNETGIPSELTLPTTNGSTVDIVNIAKHLDIQVTFRGNVASSGGSAIYGGVVDRCIFLATVGILGYRDSNRIFDQMFSFSDIENDTSMISSNPYRLCICNSTTFTPMCNVNNPNVTLFPGQTCDIYAVAIGQRNGTSPGVVFGEFINRPKGNGAPAVKHSETTQQVSQNCTRLSYTMLSTQIGVNLQLLLGLENTNIQRDPTIVNIRLLPCPPGFSLSNDPPSCQCHPFLTRLEIECNISSETVFRVPSVWLSRDWDESALDQLLLYEYCPLDYCISDEFDYNISQRDVLCAFNRAGVLCGQCQPGYSLTLGTNECEMCTNDYLALLIPFAVAGLLLVLLLLIFSSLTVSIGAINGLIFYANIVQINKGILFPPGDSNFLTTFIAWLNLDLGIKTCFYDGMDAYAKTFFQFVFPVYVWTIIGIVIVLGHYVGSVSKLLGDKGVPVLATVFLLSVAKLQRTIIIGLTKATILHSDNRTTYVWYNDGNMVYLKGKHIYLFVLSLAMLIFIMFPFYLSLLFVPCLQALSSHRPFRFVNRCKPLIDAFVGPYKDRHRYWTGFLLCARALLFLLFSQFQPWVNLSIMIVSMQLISVFTWVGGGVYKKWPLNALEFSFFANLGILSMATLVVLFYGGKQEGVIYTSVSIAFLEFLGIVVYAIFHQLDTFFEWNTNTECIKEKLSRWLPCFKTKKLTTNDDEEIVQNTNRSITFSEILDRGDPDSLEGSVNVVELREPLLESGPYST